MRTAQWSDYFARAARLMALNPPPVTDLGILRSLAALNLQHFDATLFNTEEAAAIEAGVAEAQQLVLQGGGSGYSILHHCIRTQVLHPSTLIKPLRLSQGMKAATAFETLILADLNRDA